MKRRLFVLFIPVLFLIACDPLAPTPPTPVVVIVTGVPSATPPPTPTPPPTATRTPPPSPTPILTPSPTPFPCDDDSGQFVDFRENFSEVARENLRFRVYLPPCYIESQVRFPYVILLHGAGFDESQWDDIGVDEALDQAIRLGVLGPMILVMPYWGQIGQLNQFPPDPSYETVILEELLPTIERDFCTINNRDYRAIGGISRGGFWAYSIAMRHPDIFGSVGGHSAFFPDNTALVPPAFNPLELALNSSFLEEANLRMYLDNGASDSAGPSQQRFSSRLTERGIPHQYVINPIGEHDNSYWSEHVDEYLTFYGRNWPRSYSELPSCLQPSP